MIREKATSVSQKASADMVKHSGSKYPQVEYTIGSMVLVKRFSSKSRKTAGNKSARKATRIVRGTIVEQNHRSGKYKIRYALLDRQVEEWFSTSDITSLTLEEENRKHREGEVLRDSLKSDVCANDSYPCSSSSHSVSTPKNPTNSVPTATSKGIFYSSQ